MDVATLVTKVMEQWDMYQELLSMGLVVGAALGLLVHLLGYGVSTACAMMKNL